jgi:hypothetical protein
MFKAITSISGFLAGDTIPADALTDEQTDRLLDLGAIVLADDEQAGGKPKPEAKSKK